jgi:hypothetical protein
MEVSHFRCLSRPSSAPPLGCRGDPAPTYAACPATIAHLRDVLSDQTYESLARKGETMTTGAMATYAYDQIDQARTELEQPADSTANTKDRP